METEIQLTEKKTTNDETKVFLAGGKVAKGAKNTAALKSQQAGK